MKRCICISCETNRNGVRSMVIDNKNWLDDLYCWLNNAYEHKEAFREFCSLMSDLKKCGFSYDELYTVLTRSEKIAEDVIGLSIMTKNNYYYKYRVPEETYRYFCDKFFHHLLHSTDTMLLKDFLEREDCEEYKEFDIFVSEQYKAISCRTMNQNI